MKTALLVSAALGMTLTFGCSGRPSLLPNSDPDLRKTMAQLGADAAKRHPYKSDAPIGGEAKATANVDLVLQALRVLNYSEDDWTDVDVWVNKNYVVHLANFQKGHDGVKTLYFTMLMDDSGNSFSTDSGKNPVQTVELYRNGKMYSVPMKLSE